MTRARARLLALLGSFAFVALNACMTDHDALEKMPNQGTGAGGAGGVFGVAGRAPTAGGGNGGSSGRHPDDEAPGASVLTFVHGVVDAPSVLVCLATVGIDGGITPFGSPLSDGPLAYGQNLVLPAITGADPATDVIEPFLIAGDLELVSGLDCPSAIERAQAEEAPPSAPLDTSGAAAAAGASGAPELGAPELGAGGSSAEGGAPGAVGAGGAPDEVQPRLRVRGLPAIPAGTLNGGRSTLLVATGCLGGTGFSAAHAEQFCGDGYTEHNPTVSAILLALSRATSPGHVGLQVVHASQATGTIDLSSRPGLPSTDDPILIAENEVEGGLLPRPAYIKHTAFDYGTTRGYDLEVATQNATLLTEGWVDVLARGGVSALVDGSNYVLVLIGPRADSKAGAAFWSLPAITVVAADPK